MTACFWDRGSGSLHVANGKAACKTFNVVSLEVKPLLGIVLLVDIFKPSAIVYEKLSCHTMAKRLLLETLELNDRLGVEFRSA